MLILENGSNSLPAPNRPAYFAQRDIEMEQPRDDTQNSNNTVTLIQLWRGDRVLRGGQLGSITSTAFKKLVVLGTSVMSSCERPAGVPSAKIPIRKTLLNINCFQYGSTFIEFEIRRHES
jgi:hypothetical protein